MPPQDPHDLMAGAASAFRLHMSRDGIVRINWLKPAPRLEQVGDEHSKRVQDRKHRSQG